MSLGSIDLGQPVGGAPILISTAAADAALGTTGRHELTIALPTDGQACFTNGSGAMIHCVARGCVTTLVRMRTDILPSPVDGMSVQRQADDTWQEATPTPNAMNTTGTAGTPCATGTDAGPGADAGTDAGSMGMDGGAMGTDAGTTDDGGGCNVGVAGRAPLGVAVLLGGLMLWRCRPVL